VHLLRSEPTLRVVEALPAEALTSDRYRSALEDATVICLSLVSTHSPARARYLARRLSRRAPRARILIGLWQLDTDDPATTAATIARPNIAVATSLYDAVTKLQSDLAIGRTSARVY